MTELVTKMKPTTRYTPQKSNIDTNNCHFLKGPVTFSKAHHFGALQPLVFGSIDFVFELLLADLLESMWKMSGAATR